MESGAPACFRASPPRFFRRFRAWLALVVALGGRPAPAPAADDVWFAPITGVWTNLPALPPPNPPYSLGVNTWWGDASVPTAADSANFPHTSTYGVSFPAAPANIGALNLTAGNVTFVSSGGRKTLTPTGGTLISSGSLTLGTSGNPMTLASVGVNVQNGGTLNVLFDSSVPSSVGMNIGTASGSSGTLSLQGNGSSASHSSLFSLGVGNANVASAPSAINIGTLSSGASYTTGAHFPTSAVTINPTGSINIGTSTTTGTFNANQNVLINGGAMNRANGSIFALAAGRSLTVQNGGAANFSGFYSSADATYLVTGNGSTFSAGSLALANGATMTIGAGAALTTASQIDVGTLNASGELLAAGLGATVTAASAATSHLWGVNGTANVTFSNQATGTFNGRVQLASGGSFASFAELTVDGNADLTVGALDVAAVGINPNAVVTVTGAGSTLTMNPSRHLTMGNSTAGSAIVTVSNGASLVVGTGSETRLRATGTLNIDGGAVDLKTLIDEGGAVNFTAGSLSYLGALVVGHDGLLGDDLNLASTRSLTLSGPTTVEKTRTLTLSGGALSTAALTVEGTAVLQSGALAISPGGAVNVQPTGRLQVSAAVNAPIIGSGAASAIEILNSATLGAPASFNGFQHQGTLAVGNHAITLNSAGYARLGSLTTMAGGTINAPNGVTLASGSNLVASGAVNARIAGELGAVIQAAGALSLGAASSPAGFAFAGELRTLQHTVTLNSSSQAALGNLTTLGAVASPGVINANNGVVVDFGESLTGFGTINSANLLAKRTIINGTVQGTSPTQPVTLTGWIKGVGAFDNVVFAGTTDLGLSPAISTVGSVAFSDASTLVMELGGTTRGAQYDAIIASGTLTLAGTLQLTLIDGFAPAAGQVFDIFDWGSISGAFDAVQLPALAGALSWNTSALYTAGTLSVASSTGFTADFDNDGDVDADDLNNRWKPGFGPGAMADADGDNDSDGNDFLVWQREIGGAPATVAASAVVPEPATSTMMLLCLSAATLAGRAPRPRRRPSD
jgi:T5SS/PEP-CTERM-associated repeat protein